MKKTLALTLGAFLLALNEPTYATVQYWDPDNNGANNNCSTGVGFGGSTGNWSTAVAAWTSSGCGTGTDVAWTEGNDAVFWGTAGLAILSGPRTVGNLTFQTAGYTITNSTLTFSGAGKGVITLPGSGTTLITSGMAGSIGYSVVGPGTLKLTNTSLGTITGPVSVTSSAVLELSSSGAIGGTSAGAGDITINGGTYQDDTTGVDTLTANRLFNIGASGGTFNIPSSAAILIYNGWIQGSGNTLTVTGSGDIRLQTNSANASYGHNTFSKLVVDTGLVTIGQSTTGGVDECLGATPASFTADAVTLKNGGKLRGNSYNFSLSANRGITINNGGSIGAVAGFTLTVPQQITGSSLLKINDIPSGGQDTGAVFFTADNSSTLTSKILVKGGTLNFNADNNLGAVPGSPTADAITLTNGSALAINQTMTMNANRGITIGNASSGFVATVSGVTGTIAGTISGSGAFSKSTATGTLILSGANTYTGKTTLNGGSTSVSSLNSVTTPAQQTASSLGKPSNAANGTISMGSTTTGATLIYTGSGETTDRIIDLAGTTGGATLQNDGTGALVFTSAFTASGAGAKTLTLTGSSTANNTINNTIVDNATANKTSVTKSGNGTWTLAGANTYSGNTTLNSGGTLNLANASALGTGTFVIGGNGSFDNTSAGALTLANAMTMSGGSPTYIGSANNATISGAVTISAANRNITVSARTLTLNGAIGQDASARNLTKQGAGTLVINGTSTYTGSTVISAGTLRVDGNIASSSTVNVNNNGTLGGNGTVPGLTVNNGGTISPGASPGTLTTGAETWAGGGSYVWEINDFNGVAGNNWDTLQATSLNITATTASKFNIKVTSLSGTSAGSAANFDGNTDYDIVILHTANGITGNGVAAINVDASAFQNTLGAGGFFFVSVSGNDLVLSYRRAAVITSNPSSLNLNAGQTANFTGSAAASGTVSYQWKKGGVNLSNGSQPSGSTVSGATTGNLTLASVGYLDEGAYTLVATGTYGPAASSTAAALTVVDPPVITNPITDSTVTTNAGQTVHLTVTQTGRVGTYQWKKGASNLSNGAYENGATISGASSANLTLTGVLAADAGVYNVTVSTVDGNATSANTTLVVNDPVITAQPANSTFECGSSNALTVTAVGTTNLTYQWYSPDPSGTAITDATNSALPFPTVSFANGGSYSVVVSNALGNSITSLVVVVTVEDTNAPVVTVNAGTDIVECHTSFTDAGASATDSCDGSLSVTESGSVDANTVGVYTLTYSATDSHGNTSTATRVVTVHDTTAPSLTLTGSAETTISCGTPYTDAGATASDSCAGNITGSIVVNYGGLNPTAPVGGDYTITYNVQDPAGNAATAVTRLVHVVDLTAPVITLNGASSVTVECHSSYTDAGATANDNCAGVVTPTTTGTVDANTVGVYTLTYTATDGVNTSTATRVVHVTDTTAPVVTLNGPAAVMVECHGSYSDPSASASDDCDAGASVATSGTVDLNTVNVYTRTYTASDASGNHSSTTRQITVHDTTAPAITVTGSNPASVECHTSYTDAGATATDTCDANPGVTSSGSVDANTAGSYTLTYTATDASGNTSTATRVVTVSDSTAPVVTLNGAASVTVECHGSFSDQGATAADTCDAHVTVSTTGAVDANTPGNYTLTYSSTDSSGNTGSATRVVTVSDTAAPIVSLNGAASMNVECHGSFTDPGASANDLCEGPVSVTTIGSVDANTVGNYTLTYTACDSGNRCASVTRVVHVADTAAPVVTINGTSPMNVECHGSFADPGATSADNCDAGPSIVTTSNVDANTVGSYTVTYTATDANGNSGSATRVVTVTDSAAPVITVTGGDQTIECHSSFTDAGATANDTCTGDLTSNIQVVGSVDANTVGSYTLTYSVADASGNNASATRTVTVHDTTVPVITVTGGTTTNVCLTGSYIEYGATATDTCSGDLTSSIQTTGTVDTSVAGDYTITYSVTDPSGNNATATRVVTVGPCSATISQQPQGVTVNANAPFTLNVTATGPVLPLTYQWKTNGVAIPGATDSSFTVAHAFRANAGTYTVDVTSGPSTVTSDNAIVKVIDPVFTLNPSSATLTIGIANSYAMNVVLDGSGTSKLQWYFATGTKTNKAASTSSTLTLNPLKPTQAGSYFCVATNLGSGICITSAPATVVIYQAPKVAAVAPRTVSLTEGGNGSIKVIASSLSGPLHYQWGVGNPFVALPEGGKYIGTTTPSLTIIDAQMSDNGTVFRCQVGNLSASNVLSSGVPLTVVTDSKTPVLNIKEPKDNSYLSNITQIEVTGTAVDKGGITSVWLVNTNFDTVDTVQVTNVTHAIKSGVTNAGKTVFTNVLTLVSGTNVITAFGMNESSVGSSVGMSKKHTVFLVDPAPFTVAITGPGTVSGKSAGKLGKPSTSTILGVNIGYQITAKPASTKNHFVGWFDQNDQPYPSSPANTEKVLNFTIPTTDGLSLKAVFQ